MRVSSRNFSSCSKLPDATAAAMVCAHCLLPSGPGSSGRMASSCRVLGAVNGAHEARTRNKARHGEAAQAAQERSTGSNKNSSSRKCFDTNLEVSTQSTCANSIP